MIGQPPVVVPMKVVHGAPFVQATIDGHGPYWFLVDTGTDPSVVDREVAKLAGEKMSGLGHITGGGTEKVTASGGTIRIVETGAYREHDVQTLFVDLSKLSSKLGLQVGGVLGYSFLRNTVVKFDFASHQLALWNPDTFVAPQGRCVAALPFHYDDDVLIDDVYVNGHRVVADVDTGSNGTVSVTPEAVIKLDLQAVAASASPSSGVGYLGAYESKSGMIDELQLGPLAKRNVPATYWTTGTGHDEKKWDVNIGNGIWSTIPLTIDYSRNVLYLQTC